MVIGLKRSVLLAVMIDNFILIYLNDRDYGMISFSQNNKTLSEYCKSAYRTLAFDDVLSQLCKYLCRDGYYKLEYQIKKERKKELNFPQF